MKRTAILAMVLVLSLMHSVRAGTNDLGSSTQPNSPNKGSTQTTSPTNPLQAALLKWAPYSGVTFPVGTGPLGVAFDGANIWVVSQVNGTVTKLRATNGNANTVTKLRASDGAALGTFQVGNGPFGVTFDGTNIWVANFSNASVTELRPSDGTILGTFHVEGNPRSIAFDGANIWVTVINSGNVNKL
jgi:hypothetical protein